MTNTETMKNPKLIPINGKVHKKVDSDLLGKAVAALVTHHQKKVDESEKLSLMGNDTIVQVQIGLELAPVRPSPKPIRVMIPHPIFQVGQENSDDDSLEEPEICLIVKEESKLWVQDMIRTHSEHMKHVKKVLGLESLRKKHAQFSQRRELLSKYNVFMADDRILPMLTKALGKEFFKAKKLPIPVRLTRKEALPFAIRNALNATYMSLSEGTCITVKAGSTAMSSSKLVQNIEAITENAVANLPRKWANIRSISIKTPNSVALPVYNKTPAELIEITRLARLSSAWKDTLHDDKSQIKKEEVQKKRKDPTKSPLVRALKKQKKDGIQSERASHTIENEAEPVHKKSAGRGKATDLESETKSVDAENSIAASNTEIPKSVETEKKITSDTTKMKTTKSTPEKKSLKTKSISETQKFIESKKFQDSKRGYVFRRGKLGVGYYIDHKPVIDKKALDALLRTAKGSGKRGSPGGRKIVKGGGKDRRSRR